MVDLSSGSEGGPIEHRFDNWIFVGPAIFVILLVGKRLWRFFRLVILSTIWNESDLISQYLPDLQNVCCFFRNLFTILSPVVTKYLLSSL